MSAQRPGAVDDYSKGQSANRAAPATSRGLLAIVALAGAAALAMAEFSTLYEIVTGPLEMVWRAIPGRENHAYAMLVIAGCAVPVALIAARGGGTAALALLVLGATALFVTVAVDERDIRAVSDEREVLTFQPVDARRGPALYLEGGGGAALILAGACLLALRTRRDRTGVRGAEPR